MRVRVIGRFLRMTATVRSRGRMRLLALVAVCACLWVTLAALGIVPLLPMSNASSSYASSFNTAFHESLWTTTERGGGRPDSSLDGCHYRLRIAVFAFNRPDAFARLWSSLVRLVPVHCVSGVHVFQDYEDAQSDAWHLQRKVLSSLRPLSFAPLTLHYARAHVGLRHAILGHWDPDADPPPMADMADLSLMLEDDIELSPIALQYIERVAERFMPRNDRDAHLYGIALYSPYYNDVAGQFFSASQMNTTHPFAYQYPSSWGVVHTAHAWRRLRASFSAFPPPDAPPDARPFVPHSLTNLWPAETSWKMFMVRLLVEDGAYLLYPRANLSMSRNEGSVGAHVTPEAVAWFNAHYHVDLAMGDAPLALNHSSLSALTTFDLWRGRVAQPDALRVASRMNAVREYDAVILVVDAGPDARATDAAIAHYVAVQRVQRVIVLRADEHDHEPLPDHLRCKADRASVQPSPAGVIVRCVYTDAMDKYRVLSRHLGEAVVAPVLIVPDCDLVPLHTVRGALHGFRESGYRHAVTSASQLRHVAVRGETLTVYPTLGGVKGDGHMYIPLGGLTVVDARVLSEALRSMTGALRAAAAKVPMLATMMVYNEIAQRAPLRRLVAVKCAGEAEDDKIETRLPEPSRDVAKWLTIIASNSRAAPFVVFDAWLPGEC